MGGGQAARPLPVLRHVVDVAREECVGRGALASSLRVPQGCATVAIRGDQRRRELDRRVIRPCGDAKLDERVRVGVAQRLPCGRCTLPESGVVLQLGNLAERSRDVRRIEQRQGVRRSALTITGVEGVSRASVSAIKFSSL